MNNEEKLLELIEDTCKWTFENIEKAPLSDEKKKSIKDFIESFV